MAFARLIENSLEKGVKILGEGEDGVVIPLGKKLAAKIYKDKRRDKYPHPRELAKKEFEIGNYLKEQGVAVPKMIEIVPFHNFDRWALVMQQINGYTFEEARKITNNMENKKEKQIRMAIYSGYQVPQEAWLNHNVMYDQEKNRVYLIDFVIWKKKGEKYLF